MTKVAIIGGGPRGLSALESLVRLLSEREESKSNVSITLYEASDQLGSSHVYDINQPDTNWINISERAMKIEERLEIEWAEIKIPLFPSYADWNSKDRLPDIDTFPPRSHVGKYLQARFNSIADTLVKHGMLTIVKERVIYIVRNEKGFSLTTTRGTNSDFDEVLLTIGHQETRPSGQIKKWKEHVARNENLHLFEQAYPIKNLLKDGQIYEGSQIALRGFGLAMIDVVRALTIGLGGRFHMVDEESRSMKYESGGREPSKIIPFSLDGLPIVPKPLNEQIDKYFEPTEEQQIELINSIREANDKASSVKSFRFFTNTMKKIIAEIYYRLGDKAIIQEYSIGDVAEFIDQWFEGQNFQHDLIVPTNQPPQISMESFVLMAVGKEMISLDYCIGQVWRHLQPLMYKEFAFSKLKSSVIAEIVQLDERIKRYSYGAPVDSIQQLLALIAIGILKISVVDDPDIKQVPEGWKFRAGDSEFTASIIINTVLDGPNVLEVETPLVKGLLEDGMIRPIHEELGVVTAKDGCVITNQGDKLTLALSGRLAKGTLLGVDAILECFTKPLEYWAGGVIERLN